MPSAFTYFSNTHVSWYTIVVTLVCMYIFFRWDAPTSPQNCPWLLQLSPEIWRLILKCCWCPCRRALVWVFSKPNLKLISHFADCSRVKGGRGSVCNPWLMEELPPGPPRQGRGPEAWRREVSPPLPVCPPLRVGTREGIAWGVQR